MNKQKCSNSFRQLAGICLLVLLACIPGRGHAQTFPNPSFEANTFTEYPGYARVPGDIIGWIATPNSAGVNPWFGLTGPESQFANNGATPHGSRVAFVQSTGAGSSLATMISGLTLGAMYEVTFRANCRSGFVVPNPAWSLNAGPFVPFTASPAVGEANPYYTNSRVFAATGPTAALVISNFTTGDSAVLVDDFSVSPVPLVVTTTNDSGPGSLRAAVAKGNAVTGVKVITFAPELSGTTVVLVNQLVVTNDLIFDASPLAGGVILKGAGERLLLVETNTTVELHRLVFTGGNGHPDRNIRGGAIYNDGTLFLTDCSILGNRTDQGFGGGILNNRTLYLNRCTIADNAALLIGGGVNNFSATAVLFATNCTFSGNVSLSQSGGGLANINNALSTVVHCTFTGNQATNAGRSGGGILRGAGTVTLMHSIVAGNFAPTGPDLSGVISFLGANITNGNALLAPLGDYGGPTPTAILLPGTPALDAAVGSTTPVDQRGRPRPTGTAADLGAVEAGLPTVVTLPPSGVINDLATLHALASPNGLATKVWFEWGRTIEHENQTAPMPLSQGGVSVLHSASHTGFTPGLLLNCRVVASNTAGVVRGGSIRFGSPTIAPQGLNPVPVECHDSYFESGALALPVAVAGGFEYSLGLRSDGKVMATGNAQPLAGLSNVLAIAGGMWHGLALRSDSTVAAWGDNRYGQAGVPGGLTNVAAVAAGSFHSLAVRGDGSVAAWGAGGFVEGAFSVHNGQSLVPPTLTNVTAVAGGHVHSLALRRDGTVAAWGNNAFGQAETPAQLSNVVAIAAGFNYNLALRRDGTVVAWGDNQHGQLQVPASLSNAVAIAAGGNHALALRADGTVVAWAANYSGQAEVPVPLSNVVAIAAGNEHSLALRADGRIVAWGRTNAGQTTLAATLNAPRVGGSVNTNLPGSYSLTYATTNFLGGVGTATRTVVVADTRPPVVSLLGSSAMVILTNSPFVDPGATALDLCGGSLPVATNAAVNPSVPGDYLITYTSTDASGNTGSATRTVKVGPVSPTVITLSAIGVTNTTGTLTALINPNFGPAVIWFEWGATTGYGQRTAPVAVGGGGAVVPHSAFISGFPPGLTNHARAVGSNALGVVFGNDIVFGSPIVTFLGAPVVTNECHTPYFENFPGTGVIPNPSFEADVEFYAGHGYASQNGGFITGWTLSNPDRIGINSGPEFLLGGPFVDNGLTPDFRAAFLQSLNNESNTLTTHITGLVPGTLYQVTFRANARAATSAPGPAWSLNGGGFTPFTSWPPVGGANPYYTNHGTFVATSNTAPLVIANQSAEDSAVLLDQFSIAEVPARAGDLPASASGVVDTDTPGSYALTYTGTNFLGGVGTATRTILVVDTTPPVITVTGTNLLNVAIHTLFDDPGLTVSDVCAGPGPFAITTNSTVNTAVAGTYSVTYTATDSAGNAATNSRVVLVVAAPTFSGVTSVVLGTNLVNGTRTVQFTAGVNPNGQISAVHFQYGLTTAYGGISEPVQLPAVFTTNNATVTVTGFGSGFTYHWRVTAANSSGSITTADQTFTIGSPADSGLPGDINGDGIVSQAELDAVYGHYLTNSPWLQMTNVLGLGTSNVNFALPNPAAGGYTVEATTDLVNWMTLGVAAPRYEFTDTNAPAGPARYYRLRHP